MNRYSWEKALCLFAVGLMFCGAALGGTYSGGTGAPETPYRIGTVNDWLEFIAAESDWDKHFEIIADIDFGGIALTPAASATVDHYDYDRFVGIPFSGIINGNGHALSNATILLPDTDCVGLFGYCTGTIQNVTVQDLSISGADYIGGLVALNQGTLSNCSVDGQVQGGDYTGGLVGWNQGGDILSCHAQCSVSGGKYTGGLTGFSSKLTTEDKISTIEQSSASGNVTSDDSCVGGLVGFNDYYCTVTASHATGHVVGSSYVGGLVGVNYKSVDSCFATGNVTGLGEDAYAGFVGGLVGENLYGVITNSYATGAVTGHYAVGGLAGLGGHINFSIDGQGIVRGCFASGAVSGADAVGGLVGSGGKVIACYATGPVTGETQVGGLAGLARHMEASYAVGAVTGNKYVGGLAGSAQGNGWDCFWNRESSGQAESASGKGLAAAQMLMPEYFSMANWGAYEWVMEEGDWPRLIWEETGAAALPAPPPLPFSGSGTSDDPYQISSADEFALLSWNILALDKHFRLTRDIDLAGVKLYPIGDSSLTSVLPFTGVFEGAGHCLKNVALGAANSWMANGSALGLFSVLGENGHIRNLHIRNMEVVAMGDLPIGMLAGWSGGSIHNCHVDGEIFVTSALEAGGLVGHNGGQISLCSIQASLQLKDLIEGTSVSFGGAAGGNSGVISNTTVSGQMSGHIVGGLVGSNGGEIVSCRSKANISGYMAGGLAGGNGGRIAMSSSHSDVVALDTVQLGAYAGGVVGRQHGGELTSCFASGSVICAHFAGGLVGLWEAQSGSISNCYTRSTVYDRDPENETPPLYDPILAGLVARTEGPGSIVNCFAAGAIVNTAATPLKGGLIAARMSIPTGPLDEESGIVSVASCYWDQERSRVYVSEGGTGRITRAMTYPHASGVYSGWDFTETWAADTNFSKNDGYPWLPKASEAVLPRVSVEGTQRIELSESIVLGISVDGLDGPLTADWFHDGVLVQTGPDLDYVVLYADDWDAGNYWVIITDDEGNSYRSPDFLVRVEAEGSLPASAPGAMLLLLATLTGCAIHALKKHCRS